MGIKYKELKNTYNLPSGDPLRRVLVKFFREQRKAFNDWLASEQRKLAPFQLDRRVLLECKLFPPVKFPGWDHLGLGAKVLQKRILPVIEPVWESSGTKTLSRLRSARAKKLRRKDLSLDFSVTNPKIKQAIEEATLRFSQETNDTTSLDLEDALAQVREDLESGMESGDTISEIADNIKDVFDKAEDFRAERIAATETSRAYHQAQMLADEESGVVPGYEWLASEDACQEICQAIMEEAQFIQAGTPFAIVDDDPDYGTIYFPPAHPNCCLPGTRIVAPLAVAGLEVHYEGPVVRLRFDNGADLTVTPNHMLLTVDGFYRVSSLMEGDDIIRYYGPIHSDFIGNTKDYDCPATIQQVVNSLSESSGSVTSYVSVAADDLHGDGTFGQGDIRVVMSNRFPGGCCNAEQLEMAIKADLIGSDSGGLHFSDYCLLIRILWDLFSSTESFSGSDRDQHSLVRAKLRLANVLSLESVPAFDTGSFKAVFDDGPGNAEDTRDGMLGLATLVEVDNSIGANYSLLNPSSRLSLPGLYGDFSFNESVSQSIRSHTYRLREVADRFPSQITTCKITNIDVLHYSGPVYDVQTLPTLYLIDHGIVSSNCQCTYVEVLDTDDPQPEWGETYIVPPKGGKKKSFVSIPWRREESLIEVGFRALNAIEAKFNQYHDEHGRFADGPGDSSGNYRVEYDGDSGSWHIMDGEYGVSVHKTAEEAASEVNRLGMVDHADKLEEQVVNTIGKLRPLDNATSSQLDSRISALRQAIQAVKPEVADQIAQDMASVAEKIAGSSSSTVKPRFSVKEETDETGTHYILMERGRVSQRFDSQSEAQSALDQTVKFYQSEKLVGRLERYIGKLPGIDESDADVVRTRISSLKQALDALANA